MDLRPTLASIKEMAEYIQAEAEELSLGLPPGKTTGGVTQAPTPSVKVLQMDQNDSLSLGGSTERRSVVHPRNLVSFGDLKEVAKRVTPVASSTTGRAYPSRAGASYAR